MTALVLTAALATALAQELPDFEASSVVLRYSANVRLGENESRRLFIKAVEILQSSNFNSSRPLWTWDEARVNAGYGRSTSGRHVRVTFGKVEKIETVGGYIDAQSLIIGLNGSEAASPIHTVDAEGKIVEHAKYQGHLCVELMKLVR